MQLYTGVWEILLWKIISIENVLFSLHFAQKRTQTDNTVLKYDLFLQLTLAIFFATQLVVDFCIKHEWK